MGNVHCVRLIMSLKKLTKIALDITFCENLISSLCDYITSCCMPERIIIFGSAARQEMTEMSDLDIIVLIPTKIEIESARQAYFGQPSPIDWPVDILFMTTANFASRAAIGGVCYIAEKEGRIVYQRKDDE